MQEPRVVCCTVRDAIDENGLLELHLECRMSDGHKGAFVVVDANFPELAQKIAKFLNSEAA